MRVACWNTEWHGPRSWKGRAIRGRLLDDEPEIICCPEAYDTLLGSDWHGIFSQPDYGYPLTKGRRKVAVWSRKPWVEVDDFGAPELPSGRFVSGQTVSSIGPVRVVAICIPWAAAHVSSGRRDRSRWSDHISYLKGLRSILSRLDRDLPTILVGDFNQCIPRRTAPGNVYEELQAAIEGYEVWTMGRVPDLATYPVCHIAGSEQLRCEEVGGYPRHLEQGRTLSDHDGLRIELGLRSRDSQ